MAGTNRLEILCKIFNWHGGTIHQVNEMVSRHMGPTRIDKLDDAQFDDLCAILRTCVGNGKDRINAQS